MCDRRSGTVCFARLLARRDLFTVHFFRRKSHKLCSRHSQGMPRVVCGSICFEIRPGRIGYTAVEAPKSRCKLATATTFQASTSQIWRPTSRFSLVATLQTSRRPSSLLHGKLLDTLPYFRVFEGRSQMLAFFAGVLQIDVRQICSCSKGIREGLRLVSFAPEPRSRRGLPLATCPTGFGKWQPPHVLSPPFRFHKDVTCFIASCRQQETHLKPCDLLTSPSRV